MLVNYNVVSRDGAQTGFHQLHQLLTVIGGGPRRKRKGEKVASSISDDTKTLS